MIAKEVETKYLKLNLETNKRVLFISDIHGDLSLFKTALKKASYTENDYLFILGDVIEKGKENLKTLDYLFMMKKRNPNLYILSGNCDEVVRSLIPPADKDRVLSYALRRKNSIINEMAEEQNIIITEDMDVDAVCSFFAEKYAFYYSFLDSFLHVVELNEKIILVHAGIMDIHDVPQKAKNVLKLDHFYFKSPKQEKLMIVGHFPTRNYRKEKTSQNPLVDYEKNIICIDGGNNVCHYGQLNILELESFTSMKFTFSSVNHFPKIKILKDYDYKENNKPFSIIYGAGEIEVLNEKEDFSFCRHCISGNTLWILSEWIHPYEGKKYAYDGTNQFLSLKQGDIVSLVKYAQPFCLLAKEGSLGLVETKELVMENVSS